MSHMASAYRLTDPLQSTNSPIIIPYPPPISNYGIWIRLRHGVYSSLPAYFRLGSGAGGYYRLVWLAMSIIPIFHGTAWWTTDLHAATTAPVSLRGSIRGMESGNGLTCDGTSITDYNVDDYVFYNHTSLRPELPFTANWQQPAQ